MNLHWVATLHHCPLLDTSTPKPCFDLHRKNVEANKRAEGYIYIKTLQNYMAKVETESIIPAFTWPVNMHAELQSLRMA